MNIDINQYCKILESIIQSDSEGIVFFDSEGEYIFEWNPNGYEDLNTIDTKKIFSSKSNMHTINISGKRYIVNELCNTTYQLNMVSVMPVANIYIESMDLVVIFTAFGCVAAVVLLYLAYVSSKHYFEKIEYLIETFQKAEQGDYPTVPIQEIKNEYDVVFNNIIYLFLHNVKLKQEILVKEKEQKAIELSALQFQINPHFLFNILQTVQFEIGKLGKDAVVARSTIDSLSDILRYSLGTSRESIELKEEILYLKKYIEIQRVRFGNSFIVYYEIDDELEQAQVFRLMLQPLVENSIMHGIRQIDMNGYIKIRILKRESNIICRVMDNGVGMDQEEKRKLQEQIQRVGSRHIGLANVNCRLKLFYVDKAQIKIHSKKGMGSVMEFSIPYIEEKITV